MTLAVDLERTFSARGADPFVVDVDLTVDTAETAVVLGPSGSGKSLLLESLAGFHDPDGTVTLDGRSLAGVAPEDRGFGFVFQEYALFPHLTVRENVAFGTQYHDRTRDPDRVLADLGVADLADRRPGTLSGGEKQRVALARSLAIDPDVLLLDEPLSALDVPTRQSLREDVASVLSDVTAVYVTHDRTTARAIGDSIAVMRDGEIVQRGPPNSAFDRPDSPFVARFTGANCVPAADLPESLRPGSSHSHVAIRPEHVRVGPGDVGTVERVVREEATHRVTLRVGATSLSAFVTDPPEPGDRVGVELPSENVVHLDG